MGTNIEDPEFPGRGKSIGMVGVPLGYGAEHKGSDLGVDAIRFTPIRGKTVAGHLTDLGYEFKDHGDVEIVKPSAGASEDSNPKYLPEILESSRNMVASVGSILESGAIPLILGGDHSIAIGTQSGVSNYYHQKGGEVGLIWFDAHADMNTPDSSPSGNIHGMPLATLFGYGDPELVGLGGFSPKINPKYCAHIGARDLDAGERALIRELGMVDNFFTMSDIDKRGMLACVEDAIKIASGARSGYSVTFDIDVIDPRFAPGSGTLVRGGLTYREAHLGLEILAEHDGMRSFEIVEVNPLLDSGNLTVEVACELILSAFGKKIL